MDVIPAALVALEPSQIERGMSRLLADLGLLDLALGAPPTVAVADHPLEQAA